MSKFTTIIKLTLSVLRDATESCIKFPFSIEFYKNYLSYKSIKDETIHTDDTYKEIERTLITWQIRCDQVIY